MIVWRITCLRTAPRIIMASPTLRETGGAWVRFAADFLVPQTGCPAQSVRLVMPPRAASVRMATGTIWFDDMKIVRGQ